MTVSEPGKVRCGHETTTLILRRSDATDPSIHVFCETCGAQSSNATTPLLPLLIDLSSETISAIVRAVIADDCPHNRAALAKIGAARESLGLGEPPDTLTATLALIAELVVNLTKDEHADHGAMPPPAELARELLVNLGNLYVEADNAAEWTRGVHRRIAEAVASSCADVNMPFLLGQLLIESLQQAQRLIPAVDACSDIGSLDLAAPSPI